MCVAARACVRVVYTRSDRRRDIVDRPPGNGNRRLSLVTPISSIHHRHHHLSQSINPNSGTHGVTITMIGWISSRDSATKDYVLC